MGNHAELFQLDVFMVSICLIQVFIWSDPCFQSVGFILSIGRKHCCGWAESGFQSAELKETLTHPRFGKMRCETFPCWLAESSACIPVGQERRRPRVRRNLSKSVNSRPVIFQLDVSLLSISRCYTFNRSQTLLQVDGARLSVGRTQGDPHASAIWQGAYQRSTRRYARHHDCRSAPVRQNNPR